jgi:hypothetical protein
VLIAGEELGGAAVEAGLDLVDDLLGALPDASPGDHRQDEPELGIEGDVVPPVPLVVIDRVGGVLQPIMPLDLPVKVRSWELTVYPRSHIRRWLGATRSAKARM